MDAMTAKGVESDLVEPLQCIGTIVVMVVVWGFVSKDARARAVEDQVLTAIGERVRFQQGYGRGLPDSRDIGFEWLQQIEKGPLVMGEVTFERCATKRGGKGWEIRTKKEGLVVSKTKMQSVWDTGGIRKLLVGLYDYYGDDMEKLRTKLGLQKERVPR